jgi:hypothetical protein
MIVQDRRVRVSAPHGVSLASDLLKQHTVVTNTDFERWSPLVPNARVAPVEPRIEGERRLMAELLNQAIMEATYAPSALRDEARAWLTEAPMFTARECFESLGLEYDVALVQLREKWTALDAAVVDRRQARAARRNAR